MKKLILMFTLFLCFAFSAVAQQIIVRGAVYDEYGTIPGILVRVKGTNVAALTDVDGNFTIKCKIGDVLVFSGLGYEDQFVTITNRVSISNVKVYMEFDAPIIVTPDSMDYAFSVTKESFTTLFDYMKKHIG